MHSEYILTLILKTFSCLYCDFNQFYENGYVKFSVSENRSNFLFFKYIEILFNKHALIDVDITTADIMQLF